MDLFYIETAKVPLKPEVERVEPEKIRKWREDQQKRLAEKGKTDYMIIFSNYQFHFQKFSD